MVSKSDLSRFSVAVCGVIRNPGRCFSRDFGRLQRALSRFGRVSFFIVESDSEKGNLVNVECLRDIGNCRFVQLGQVRDKIPSRVNRIAYCRNIALEVMEEQIGESGVDFVICADLDGVNKCLTADAVGTSFSRLDWGAVTANQSYYYYDLFALRHPIWNPCDHETLMAFYRSLNMLPSEVARHALYSRFIRIPSTAPWILVKSAFGGLAIYKEAAVRGLRYRTDYVGDANVCEHVEFNLKVGERGFGIYINPMMINAHITEHTKCLRLGAWMLRSFRSLIRNSVFRRQSTFPLG